MRGCSVSALALIYHNHARCPGARNLLCTPLLASSSLNLFLDIGEPLDIGACSFGRRRRGLIAGLRLSILGLWWQELKPLCEVDKGWILSTSSTASAS